MESTFNYNEAFSRNIGLITKEEQEKLHGYTIGIAGMGGVGGIHLISLVRQGFERFKIADIDIYEEKNMNRQYGARLDTLGRKKVEVMKEEALKINPHCSIEIFEHGITTDTIDAFLSHTDLVVDALDAFVIQSRRLCISKSQEKNIPVISAGPIGFGTAFLIFMPESPRFDTYFAIRENMSEKDMLIRFFIGLVPKLLQRSYMQNTSLDKKHGPSSSGAVALCAGVVTIYALKILLQKGVVHAVPHYHQFDLMHNRYVHGKLWFGNKGPIQRLKILLAPLIEKQQQ